MSTQKNTIRLGKGLATLLGETIGSEALPTDKTIDIPVSQITPRAEQPRQVLDPQALNELRESVQAHGVLQPLLVVAKEDNSYQVVAGERRWRAACAAGLKVVPCIVKNYSAREIAAIALVENIQRVDLNPIELATALRSLQTSFKLTQKELAEHLGKSRTSIANSMRLLELPESVQAKVRENQLSAGHARAIIGSMDPQACAEVVIGQNLNVRETERLARTQKTANNNLTGRENPSEPLPAQSLSSQLRERVKEFEQSYRVRLELLPAVRKSQTQKQKIVIHCRDQRTVDTVLTALTVNNA